MKKIILCLTCLTLCLSACGRSVSSSLNAVDTVASSEISNGEIKQPETVDEEEVYSVEELCNLYLAGEDTMTNQYTDIGDGWIELVDSQMTYYPGAVYPDVTWDPEAVLQSYYNATAPWVISPTYGNNHLWTQDYKHHFSVDEDWFQIDGIRVKPLAEWHYIAPDDLLQAYQSGEWDGNYWWSEDYSTKVSLNWLDGTLDYSYCAYTYTDEKDPMHLAYTGYATVPEYMERECFPSYHSSSHTVYSASTHTDMYLDLPNGNLEGWNNLIRIEDIGSYVIWDDMIKLYYRGEEIQSWKVNFSEDYFIAPRWDDGVMFVYANGRVLQLLEDGGTDIILDNAVATSYGFESIFYALTFQNGILQRHEIFSGETEKIATDVVDIHINDNIVFFENAQHSIYALSPSLSSGVFYLGTESISFYDGEFSKFNGSFWDFIEQYN